MQFTADKFWAFVFSYGAFFIARRFGFTIDESIANQIGPVLGDLAQWAVGGAFVYFTRNRVKASGQGEPPA